MILKLSDLQRSLDYSLSTTHSVNRIYIIIGQYCTLAGTLTDIGVADAQFGMRIGRVLGANMGKWACLYRSFARLLAHGGRTPPTASSLAWWGWAWMWTPGGERPHCGFMA